MKLLILLLFLLCNFSYSKKPAFILYDDGTWEKVEGMKNTDTKHSNIRPEFIPIHNLLLSLLSKDKIKLKESFSKKIITKIEGMGDWQNALNQYNKVFIEKEMKGFSSMDEVTFEFEKQNKFDEASDKYVEVENEGKVTIFYKGTKVGKLNVILEENVWKMNEL